MFWNGNRTDMRYWNYYVSGNGYFKNVGDNTRPRRISPWSSGKYMSYEHIYSYSV